MELYNKMKRIIEYFTAAMYQRNFTNWFFLVDNKTMLSGVLRLRTRMSIKNAQEVI